MSGFEEPGASLQWRAHAVTDARVRADRQVALIAERGRPTDGNRAPTRLCATCGHGISATVGAQICTMCARGKGLVLMACKMNESAASFWERWRGTAGELPASVGMGRGVAVLARRCSLPQAQHGARVRHDGRGCGRGLDHAETGRRAALGWRCGLLAAVMAQMKLATASHRRPKAEV